MQKEKSKNNNKMDVAHQLNDKSIFFYLFNYYSFKNY